MSFVSVEFFILVFSLFFVYFLLGKMAPGFQWIALLSASIVFYVSAVKWFSLFLLYTVIITWSFSLLIESRNSKKKKFYLIVCLALVIGVLVFLKCKVFLIHVIPQQLSSRIVAPLGISFFTFMGIGYTVDVYRGTAPAEKNPLKYMLYLCFFPHVSQGPLDRYIEIQTQFFEVHTFNAEKFKFGIERALFGYFKKLIIANNLGAFVESIYSDPNQFSGIILAFATLMYAFQIYADFSGYMDIACGVSECLGIKLSENFKTPYFSQSIAEYWRRWHSSLGFWFRDYLYYPVLRSPLLMTVSKKLRKSGHKIAAKNVSTVIGLLSTWILIGFWHGTTGNFLAHGLFHGTIIILGTLCVKFYDKCRNCLHINEKTKTWKLFKIVRTFFLVNVGYVLFRADSLSTAITIYKRVLTKNFYFGWSHGLINPYFDKFFWVSMMFALAFCFFTELIETKQSFIVWLNRRKTVIRWGILYLMLLPVICVMLFSNAPEASTGNFLYFNF